MELYIIRHGQSTNNATGDDPLTRVHDPQLTEVGKEQAQYTAEFLKNAVNLEEVVRLPSNSPERQGEHYQRMTHVYCSAMHRALQTAQPIAKALGLKPEIWIDIHEHGGIYLEKDGVITGYGGLTRAQIMEEFPDYVMPGVITDAGWYNSAAGMEDLALCRARALRVAEVLRARAIEEATKDDKIAIVTHGTYIDSLLKAFLNMLPSHDLYYWHYNTAITRLDFLPDGKIIVRYVNRVTHLPMELVT